MNVDLVYRAIRTESEDLLEAVQWALDHWREASDRLLSKLRALCAHLEDDDTEGGNALFFLTLMFAEKQDARAYAPLCATLARDRDSGSWMGDTVWETLPKVLISLYDGDLAPLVAVAESAQAEDLVRGAALEAFGYLVRFENALTDAQAQDFLRGFHQAGQPPKESMVWNAWTQTVARLGYSDLASDAARLFSRNWVDECWTDIQEFHAVLDRARAAPEKIFAEEGVEPFASTLELAELVASRPGSDDEDGEEIDFDDPDGVLAAGLPVVNANRDVGRNDPCPCGSGKKFKKCCLAA